MRHLPRSIFSDSQMSSMQWMLASLGVKSVPSTSVLKAIDSIMQDHFGVETKKYKGPLGHTYYANDLGDIIAQVSLCRVCCRLISSHERKWQIQGSRRICVHTRRTQPNISRKAGRRIDGSTRWTPTSCIQCFVSGRRITMCMNLRRCGTAPMLCATRRAQNHDHVTVRVR